MKYLVFTLIAIFMSVMLILYLKRVEIIVSVKKEDINEFRKNSLIVYGIFGISIILFVFFQIILFSNTDIISMLKYLFLLLLLTEAAIIDKAKKIIPNELIIAGLLIRGIFYIIEFFVSENLLETLKSDMLGLVLGFGVLAVVSVITKQGLGFGDVKLFGIIGIMGGVMCTYATLFFSILVSAVVSIILLLSRKKNRKDTIPFGPCILIGYILVIILGSY